jgi:enoyl-CoA hydratase/carnithine racemase
MTAVLADLASDGVLTLTLNRPEFANAWTVDLHVGLQAELERADRDPWVRAVVLTGAGRFFCAGADTSMLESLARGEQVPPELAQHTFLRPLRLAKPLIGAINGPAAGLGFATALMCDVRLVAESAVFVTSFSKLGLVAENGVSWLLPQIVGRSRALDLLLSSRRVQADEAYRIGLADRVEPDDRLLDVVRTYASELVRSGSPASFAAMKSQINRHAFGSAAAAEAESATLVEEALLGPDFAEGLGAYLARRPPAFSPLGEGTVFSLDAH